MYSFEIGDIFYRLSLNLNLKKGYQLVDHCFERWPKDEDSITKIILLGLKESTSDFKEKLYFEILIKYLDNLYLEFLKNMA